MARQGITVAETGVMTHGDGETWTHWGLCLGFICLVIKVVRKNGWLVREEGGGGTGVWSKCLFC